MSHGYLSYNFEIYWDHVPKPGPLDPTPLMVACCSPFCAFREQGTVTSRAPSPLNPHGDALGVHPHFCPCPFGQNYAAMGVIDGRKWAKLFYGLICLENVLKAILCNTPKTGMILHFSCWPEIKVHCSPLLYGLLIMAFDVREPL